MSKLPEYKRVRNCWVSCNKSDLKHPEFGPGFVTCANKEGTKEEAF